MKIAMATLGSKLLLEDREYFSDLAVDAILRLKGSGNLDYIKLIKKAGGTLKDSLLANGFILEKSISTGCPRRKEKTRILITNTHMDHYKIKIFGSKVKVESMLKVAEIKESEKLKMKKEGRSDLHS
jgi:T-complex protein 1 subunit beta